MNSVKLSIIIPCYNSFHLMRNALEMFSANHEENFEVIVVDDGSSDDSYSSLLSYKENSKYELNVIRNDVNRGPGNARNIGIKSAKGEYITFLDSDDCFEKEYFSLVMPRLDGAVDCVIYDFKFIYSSGREWRYSSFFKDIEPGIVDPKTATAFVRGATCAKVYKRSVMEGTGILFLDQYRYEDMPFTKCLISYCTNIFYIKEPLYVYMLHEKSLIHDKSLLKIENSKNAYRYISDNLNPSMEEERKAIFAVEYLTSVSLIEAQRKKRKEWVGFVRGEESLCQNYRKCSYLREYYPSKRLEVMLIHRKAYYLIRLYLWIKRKVK